jgi:CRISPR-associated endonuclease Csy4
MAMDHYLDIKVLPDPEFVENVLMNALFAKLHRALVDVGQGEIGVSFPQARKDLGACLRLHGSVAALGRLMVHNWLKGLCDYTRVSDVQPAPPEAQHRVVRRVQVKSSVERLRRRSVSKGWKSEDEAIASIPLDNEKRSKLPFLTLKSVSTAQTFLLFVLHGPLQDMAMAGRFSDYGLSDHATVPYF